MPMAAASARRGNFLNLRLLGAIRTLILQDGNRVPGTFYDTTVDTNMPAAAADPARGGGDRRRLGRLRVRRGNRCRQLHHRQQVLTGVKGMAQGGISKYGDAKSVRLGVAYGVNVGDRGHFEASAEFYKRNGIDDTAARPYGRLYPAVIGAGTAANPYRLVYWRAAEQRRAGRPRRQPGRSRACSS